MKYIATLLFLGWALVPVLAQNKKTKVLVQADPAQWKLGIALFTFNPQSFADQLAFAKSTGVRYVEGFEFGKAGIAQKDSMILRLSISGIREMKKQVERSGLQMESMYMIGGKTLEAWKRDFEIAKAMQLRYITAEPPVNLLTSVDSLAGIYGVKVALHNHWKGNSQYWHPDSVLVAMKGRPNLFACPDFGHYPKSGIKPEEALKKLAGRVIAVHLKDIAAYGDPKLKDVPAGSGVVSFPLIFAELKRQQFAGHVIIERDFQEKPNNLASVNQTIAYFTQTLGLPAYQPTSPASTKPLRHAGLFRFKTGITPDEQDAFMKALADLKQIPGVHHLEISKQISPENKYTFGFSMHFDDADVYKFYAAHPLHDAFVQQYWLKYVADYEEIDTELLY